MRTKLIFTREGAMNAGKVNNITRKGAKIAGKKIIKFLHSRALRARRRK